MTFTLFDFIYLLGSLGLFLFGMKIMSEGIQKAAGESLGAAHGCFGYSLGTVIQCYNVDGR